MGTESADTGGGAAAQGGQRPAGGVQRLTDVMDALRRTCPWDAEQTHESLAKYLVEEAYEAVEAIEQGDPEALREELGDVLLQVAFHARVSQERPDGGFTVDDVADAITAKMVRRHPHVFAGTEVSGADDVRGNWEAIKAAERAGQDGGPSSVLDGVPFAQPAVLLAYELQKRAARNGVPEELIAAAGADGGDGAGLFAAVSAERRSGGDPEMDLRAAARRFDTRLRAAEARAREAGRDPRSLSAGEWSAYWG